MLRQRQRNPMLSIEHSLSPPTPSLTTTSSQTTYHRSNSTSLSSASTVSFSCLQIFNKILTLPKSVCCILSDWKEEKEPYLLLQYYNSELLTFTYISFFKPTQRCMLLSFRWEEVGEYSDACCRIAFAFRLHVHQITRIHSPQHPRVMCFMYYQGPSTLLQQTSPLASSKTHKDTWPTIL